MKDVLAINSNAYESCLPKLYPKIVGGNKGATNLRKIDFKTNTESVIVGGDTSDQTLHGLTGYSTSTFFPIILMYTKLTDLGWAKTLRAEDQTIAGLAIRDHHQDKVVVLTSKISAPSLNE